MIKTSKNTVILIFIKIKKEDEFASKSALIASMNKLVRIIYSLCKMVIYLNNNLYYATYFKKPLCEVFSFYFNYIH